MTVLLEAGAHAPLLAGDIEAASAPSKPPRLLQTRHVAALTFAMTCAGPFGIESCVRTMGATWAIVGVILTGIFFVLPQILVTAELSMITPLSNGGLVAWVDRAFGDKLGSLAALNMIVYQLVDLATYPSLVGGYVQQLDGDLRSSLAQASPFIIIIIGMIANIFNLRDASEFYSLILVFILSPFAVGLALSWSRLPVAWSLAVGAQPTTPALAGGPGVVDWNVYLSTMLWLTTGWDSVGNLALEVASPKALVHGMLAAAALGPLAYASCTFGALAVGTGLWDDGYLATAYGELWAPLKPWIVLAGGLSNFVIYVSELACLARMVQSMGLGGGSRLQRLFDAEGGGSVPVVAVLTLSLCQCALVAFLTFEYLVQVSVLLHVIALFLAVGAYAKMKLWQPEVPRLWTMPGGRGAAWLTILVMLATLVFLFLSACTAPSVVLGAALGNLLFSLALLGSSSWRLLRVAAAPGH